MNVGNSAWKNSCYDIKEEFWEEIITYLRMRSERELAGIIIKEWDEADEFDRILYYWLYGQMTGNIDCDASPYIMELYKKTYSHIGEAFQIKNSFPNTEKIKHLVHKEDKGCMYFGETMTSAWAPMKAYLKFLWNNNEDLREKTCNHFGEDEVGRLSFIGVTKVLRNGQYMKKATEVLHLLRFGDAFKPYFCESFRQFLRVNHTEGNMIPVPPDFNEERAGKSARYDQADLMLLCIYNWYQQFYAAGDEPLHLLFSDSDKKEIAVESCKEWLSRFKSWDAFVACHFLQAFVNTGSGNTRYGSPDIFWQGHDHANCFPPDAAAWDAFFTNCSRSICERERTLKIMED